MASNRHGLDTVASVKKDAQIANGFGLILIAVIALGLGTWGMLQPSWELARRMPVPIGVPSFLVILFGIWLTLYAENVPPSAPGIAGQRFGNSDAI